MKIVCRGLYWMEVLTLLSAAGPGSTRAGGCAVSDGSMLPSEDGCKLAFVYNQEGDHRVVVLDEKNRRRYEAPLDNSRMAPFWESGKIYVVAHSGSLQGFTIGADRLVPERLETISAGVVREAAYSRGQDRLYLIRSSFDDQRRILYELSAIDFPTRKTLWAKKIEDSGLLTIRDGNICVTGLRLVEVFDSDTGEKIGAIAAAKTATSADAKSQK